jgi:hypothetical protein
MGRLLMLNDCDQDDIMLLFLYFSTAIGDLSQVIPELIHNISRKKCVKKVYVMEFEDEIECAGLDPITKGDYYSTK